MPSNIFLEPGEIGADICRRYCISSTCGNIARTPVSRLRDRPRYLLPRPTPKMTVISAFRGWTREGRLPQPITGAAPTSPTNGRSWPCCLLRTSNWPTRQIRSLFSGLLLACLGRVRGIKGSSGMDLGLGKGKVKVQPFPSSARVRARNGRTIRLTGHVGPSVPTHRFRSVFTARPFVR